MSPAAATINPRVEHQPALDAVFHVLSRLATGEGSVGEYLEIDRPRRLVFRFGVPRYSPDLDLLTIEIVPRADGGCEFTLVHRSAPEWVEGADAAWSGMLAGLERSLAGGGDAAAQ